MVNNGEQGVCVYATKEKDMIKFNQVYHELVCVAALSCCVALLRCCIALPPCVAALLRCCVAALLRCVAVAWSCARALIILGCVCSCLRRVRVECVARPLKYPYAQRRRMQPTDLCGHWYHHRHHHQPPKPPLPTT